MAVSALKSVPVTNLDSIPVVPNTSGEGGPGNLRYAEGFVTALAADSIGSTYRLARVPSNAKIKSVWLESEAQAAGATNVGVYYSDSTLDGTASANQGLVVSASLFAAAVSLAAASSADVTNAGGTYTLDKRTQPLWQAAGLTADPGGFLDIVATLSTAITTGTGKTGVRVEYVI